MLLEAEDCLRLFGGKRALLQRLRSECASEGCTGLAVAPTSLAALALLRQLNPPESSSDGGNLVPAASCTERSLTSVLDGLPLVCLSATHPHLPTLERLGCRTLGQVRALPRGGMSRRFGDGLLGALDRAYGLRPETYAWIVLPEQFSARLEFNGRIEVAEGLIFGARRLLSQLASWLQARQRGVTAIELHWEHDLVRRGDACNGSITLSTAEATRDMQHLTRLLGENLSRTVLTAPVVAIRLEATQTEPLATQSAIRLSQPVSECGFELQPNAEAHLRPRLRLASLYPAQLMAETLRVADLCNFSLDELRYEYPEEVVPQGETPGSFLRRSTWEGAGRRFPQGVPASVQQQIEHELTLISELGYEKYFLTVYDIVRFARSRHILCQGRGSAANSAVCYCLGITEVDPSRTSVLFERFISKERNEPPDIDVDFEHQRREEVIQYLYAKYGRKRAALTAAVHTYHARGAIRDVGKALGMEPEVIDALAKAHQWWDGREVHTERLLELGLDPESRQIRLLLELTRPLLRFPRHLSQHSGGFVLTGDRLTSTVPVIPAAMEGRTTIEWDKDDIDALGLLKVDVLALGMLSAIRRTLDYVGQWRGQDFQLQDIPAECPDTYEMICRADTVGVFQIESRAQMSMLPRLQPRCFYDLVIEVAIVRPGPIQGGMVHPFLEQRERQRQGYPLELASEALRPALERTLGVPIFQEQVMQIAIIAAGFSPGEADQLRRAMAAWKRKGGVDKFHQRLVEGMTSRGYNLEFAEAIFRQIEGFGEYGFPESHAASFALLVYASAWLKPSAAYQAAVISHSTNPGNRTFSLRRMISDHLSGTLFVLNFEQDCQHCSCQLTINRSIWNWRWPCFIQSCQEMAIGQP